MSAALALRAPAVSFRPPAIARQRAEHVPPPLRADRIQDAGARSRECLTIPFRADRASAMNIKSTARRVRFGDCVLDEGRGLLIAPGGETVLRPKTFDLLRLMLDNPGRVIARNEILDAVWPNLFVTDDSITQCVVEIRKAIGPAGGDILKTLPRRGYILEAAVAVEGAPAMTATPMLSARADDRPSIAVLPFRMSAGEPQHAYFEDGIIEGIVHVLSGLDGLFVVSRGSALAFAQKSLDPRAAGHELGVRYVLYGGVRRAGGRLRITTELSETERGTILRNDRYDGEADDLFEVQDRIAERVATTILPQVKAEELARAMRKPPNSLTAYDFVLRALDAMRHLDRASLERGKTLLDQAIAADPGYGLAYSYLGWFYSWRIMQGWSPDVAADQDAAVAAAKAALDRDPADGFAMALRGISLAYMKRDYEPARQLLDQAVAASPSCALAWTWGSLVRSWLDEGEEAVAWAERGLRLAPLDPYTFLHESTLAHAHYVAGAYEAAISRCRSSVEAQPHHAAVWRTLTVSLAALGRHDEARAAGRKVIELDPGFRLAPFSARTPLGPSARDRFVRLLREAGLPE
jgi:TolB-like protein